MSDIRKIRAIDSHTGGEPTRVVIDGFPYRGNTMKERLESVRRDHDKLRSAVVREPRGHDAVVGALLCDPIMDDAAAGVIFFNNVGYLGMCGHGTIGLIKTLEYMRRIAPGTHKIDTPVGQVEASLETDGSVTITNVPSYRFARNVEIRVPGYGNIIGDVAWGGNWFFLISEHHRSVNLANLGELTDFAVAVRNALRENYVTGANGAEIDHVELFAPTQNADSRNFVLCPGLEYDRSPCGTGTSAKLACLYEDGKIREGDVWRQESIVGSIFEGRVRLDGDRVIPVIRGTASITAEIELILDENDPFCYGIAAK
jgi:4-hydroxyproline epimerase